MHTAGIMTFHRTNNYGAVLQAYALEKTICDLGVDCKIIDYYSSESIKDLQLLRKPNSIRDVIENIRVIKSYKKRKIRAEAFKNFMNKYYSLTESTFHDSDKIKNNNFCFDYYITGSDQTFNLNLKGNPKDREPFFLPFAKNGIKISYASSMGEKIGTLTQEQQNWMKECLFKYSNLSVREHQTADFISNLIGKRPEVVLDPTFLIDANEWSKMSGDTE
ncbi:MAG: polysaccharide pyruvyl transferase family protein, partial [Bacteroidales bacterium]|nr:polysaccharide pyruvyl transferase family protein [Bacteroidales bacterium]